MNTSEDRNFRGSANDAQGFRRRRPSACSSVFPSRFRLSSCRDEPAAGGNRRQGGFTLIELLTVIAIIGILAAILIPVVGSVRDSARTAQARSNVSQIGLTTHLYVDENNGRLPTDLWGLGNPQPWLIALYELSEGREFPEFGAAAHGNVLRDSIYYTPHLPSGAAEDGRQPRSFAWSIELRINDSGSGPTGARFNQFKNPSLTVCLSDTTSSSTIGTGFREQINFRNNGKALFLFLDGHVALLGPEEVPHNRNHVFWGGTETEAATPPSPRR